MKFDALVVGGGISGLALAWSLKKRGHHTAILEASDRPGGWIRSHNHHGYLFEEGPRSCRTRGSGAVTLALIEELGLTEEVIVASEEAKTRFLYTQGSLQKLPNSFWSFVTSPLTRGILPALWRDLCTGRGTQEDETIADFMGRRVGSDIALKFIDPLVAGIYAGDIQKLSMRSCFPEMYHFEQAHGSIIKGMFAKKKKPLRSVSPFVQTMLKEPIFSFKEGMETLVKALADRLSNQLELSCPAIGLKLVPDGVEVKTQEGRVWHASKVYLATPYSVTSNLLQQIGVIAPEVPAASVAVVNMGWPSKVLPKQGFGYLIPSSEKETILGVVFDSSAFSMQNASPDQTRLTVMLGGSLHPEIQYQSKEVLLDTALEAIKRHLGILQPPDASHITIARDAIPQYELGHHAKVAQIEQAVSTASAGRIHLAGSSWHGVSVNDCIAHII